MLEDVHTRAHFVEFFGPSMWKTLHSIAWTYDHPTPEYQKKAKEFFKLIGDFIPCPSCAAHYKKYLKNNPVQAGSKDKLVQWVFDLHNDVNRRSHKPTLSFDEHQRDYQWTTEDVLKFRDMGDKRLKALADPHLGREPTPHLKNSEKMEGWFGVAFDGYIIIGVAVVVLCLILLFKSWWVPGESSPPRSPARGT